MAMRLALAAHDQVLRSAIEAHGGWLFKHTPVTVCAPRSPRRNLLSTLRSLRSGRWSCRCGWGWRRVRPSCGTGTISGRFSTVRRG